MREDRHIDRRGITMLERRLKELAESDIYPFHMPGHKRVSPQDFPNPYHIDITEIEDFDNLHHPEGILKGEQERAASIYGAKQSFFLVNGSTCGILAAISAAVKRGGTLLMARNCHKAVYNACYLRQLTPVYVYPVDTGYGLQGQVTVQDIEAQLAKFPDIGAVVITSPTYDGVVSDVAAIAEAVHRRGIPLIVDEAHGAHFGLHPAFPQNATSLGADAVIMSVHKTLPAFTQTALLHLCSDRIASTEVARFLGIYETSSPSYVLMAGIDRCMRMLEEDAAAAHFDHYVRMLKDFREQTRGLVHLKVLGAEDFSPREAYAFDPGKLVIEASGIGRSGQELKELLLTQYGLQMEMASGNYVLAMTSVMDSEAGFARLQQALWELDEAGEAAAAKPALRPGDIYREQECCMRLSDAVESAREPVALSDASGRICACYICLYPPGIPILVPGEKITEQAWSDICRCMEMGLQVEGLSESGCIEVVKME